MTYLPELETGDQVTAAPHDMDLKVRYLVSCYEKQRIPLPVSGDAIRRGKADWDRD